MNDISFLGFIPAKKYSKRFPNKHHKLLDDSPLALHTIMSANNSKLINKIIISTDDNKIASYAEKVGIPVPYLRPNFLANYNTPILEVIKYSVKVLEKQGNEIKHIVLLQPTSPLRTQEHIDEAIKIYLKTKADTLTSVTLDKFYPWLWKTNNEFITPIFSYEEMNKQRHENPLVYAENGAIFIFKRSLLDKNTIYGKKVVPYIMDAKSSVDIDTEDDLKLAQFLLSK